MGKLVLGSTFILMGALFVIELSAATSKNEKCLLIKKKLVNKDSFNIVFTKKPSMVTSSDYWMLTWNNIDIPIPAIEYGGVYILKKKEGHHELILTAKKGALMVHLFVSSNKQMTDVFATSQVGATTSTTKSTTKSSTNAGTMATFNMFGGPVRHSDLLILAYNTTPAMIDCKKMTDKDSGKLLVLILKNRQGMVAVHKGVGIYAGWLEKRQSINKPTITYGVNIVWNKTPNIFYTIKYLLPTNSSYESLPYLVGEKKLTFKTKSPRWLIALNNALQTPSIKAWKIYISAARNANISEKSIKRLIKNIKGL